MEANLGGYKTNPEIDYDELDRVVKRFKEKGKLKPDIQIKMYEAISRNWCIGKAVLDAGCGIGIGTNILAREAIGTWGIDKFENNIKVAKQLYENGKVKFDVFDLVNPPARPVATFDVVCCIEVIEHIEDYEKAIQKLKSFADPKRKTIFFISSPNRNNEVLGQHKPHNPQHVREWEAGEVYEIMTKHFQSVVMYSAEKLTEFSQEETVDGSTKDTPILLKCEMPI